MDGLHAKNTLLKVKISLDAISPPNKSYLDFIAINTNSIYL